MPLIDELSLSFKIALLRNINGPYYKIPQEIRIIAESLLRDNDLNYEEIMGRIEIEIMRNHSSALRNEWHGLLSRYNEAIYFLILELHQKNLNYIHERLNLFSPISKFCSENPLWIFSLNHDSLFEIIAKHLQIPIKYGFNSKVKINDFLFEKLTRENMNSNQFSFFQNGHGINLVKTHGALDLFVNGDNKDYLKLVNESSWDGIISDLTNLVSSDAATKNYGGRISNQVTYNDENGDLQFFRMSIMSGKHKYSNRLQHTLDDWFLRIFKGHINHVHHLYCIGYSFGDDHINNVLYDWLSFSENRKITIVDPVLKRIPSNFKHLKEQIEVTKMGFLEFLNQDSDKKTRAKIKLFENARNLSRKIQLTRNIIA